VAAADPYHIAAPEEGSMKRTPEQIVYQRRHYNGPTWRWGWAKELAKRPAYEGRAARAQADGHVRAAEGYLRQRYGQKELPVDDVAPAESSLAPVAQAVALNEDEVVLGDLKVLVLGGCPANEIAARYGLPEDVVTTWELLFFDIRPVAKATDWLLLNVIKPLQQQGECHLAAKLKFATAGPVSARAIVDALERVSLRQGQSLFDQKIALMVKFQEAVEKVPIDSERAKLRFIQLHAQLMDREQRLRLAERRLEQRSQEALQKQQAAVVQQEQARRRRHEQQERTAQRAIQKELSAAMAHMTKKRRREEARQAALERSKTSPLAAWRWDMAAPPPAACAAWTAPEAAPAIAAAAVASIAASAEDLCQKAA
jgi:hypothetical protein